MNKKSKKFLIAILVIVIIIVVAFVAVNGKSNKNTTTATQSQTTSAEESPYIDVEKSNENQYEIAEVNSTKIDLNDKEYKSFVKLTESQNIDFTYDKYYLLEEELKKDYVKKGKLDYNLEVLNSNGEIDVDKLTDVALDNVDSRETNIFYNEIGREKTKEICELMVKTYNDNKDKYDINELAATLSNLRILEHKTTTKYAYVTKEIDFIYNPNTMKIGTDISKITGGEEFDVGASTMIHEMMHVLQYASSFDGSNEDVIKIGYCRSDNSNKDMPNPLFNRWILESSAETMNQAYLNFSHKNLTYNRGIRNANAVLMSFMFNKDFDRHILEKTTLSDDIYEMFDILNISDKKEQLEYLKLMNSIDTCFEYNDGFFKYYSSQTGIDLDNNEEEKDKIISTSRVDAQNYIQNRFYKALAEYVKNNDVDLETVFFLTRCFEIDSSTRLQYTRKDLLEYNKSAILNQYELQQGLFKAIAKSSGMTLDEVNDKYNSYMLYVLDDNGNEHPNCNWNSLTDGQRDFIDFTKELYSYTRMVRLNTMVDYFNKGN